ncbi:hypothetical protein K7472_29495 [Streptomyces sp. PTM05]|uniref:Beta-ketoacyl-[acyl-carrier-protein] synthase III C-terminal domain-containing protein n=1 Tax=Streptantibioticus parmotrematis TaxID=2873249 RepID=A0ABS7R0G6_9ACTN|nr:3-oxoacyl-[acyl-carrier-protein] synthase III C-terminal domain-containing protein [Streptantibioticus parmotrematis]MBY8888951.1 hypothetical protein [Streptantibioticus parmotrematis]
MGEAAAAVMVSRENYRYLTSVTCKDLDFHEGIRLSSGRSRSFAKRYLEMLVEAVEAAMNQVGLTARDVDWAMPHLANAMLWDRFCRASGVPNDRVVLDLLASEGHTYGTDALKPLRTADDSGCLKEGDRCVVIAIGQGYYIQVDVVEVVAGA